MRAISKRSRQILRNIGGAILIAVGIVGLFLPILQGIVLIIAGIALLEFDGKEALTRRGRGHPWVRWATVQLGDFRGQWRR